MVGRQALKFSHGQALTPPGKFASQHSPRDASIPTVVQFCRRNPQVQVKTGKAVQAGASSTAPGSYGPRGFSASPGRNFDVGRLGQIKVIASNARQLCALLYDFDIASPVVKPNHSQWLIRMPSITNSHKREPTMSTRSSDGWNCGRTRQAETLDVLRLARRRRSWPE